MDRLPLSNVNLCIFGQGRKQNLGCQVYFLLRMDILVVGGRGQIPWVGDLPQLVSAS